jgi:hypothetical protein
LKHGGIILHERRAWEGDRRRSDAKLGARLQESSKLSQAKLQEQRSLRLGIATNVAGSWGALLILLLAAKGTYILGVTIILCREKDIFIYNIEPYFKLDRDRARTRAGRTTQSLKVSYVNQNPTHKPPLMRA